MNWKYILIIMILASAAGWGILASKKQAAREIDAPAYVLDIKKPAGTERGEHSGREEKLVELKLFDEIRQELIFKKTDFLEINLAEMKITLYKEGLAEKKVSILTKGDPQSWGGSAAGLYKIMSGNKSSFSIVSDVYMPYALRYYGKYYLHGEPYYSWGEKLISSVSGGCLRLENKDAKTIYELTEINMPVLVIDKKRDFYEYPNEKISKLPKLSAQSYLAADMDSGYILAEKKSEEQLPIASLTKLMTAVVLAENIDLRKSILIKEEMLKAYGSSDGLTAGKRFRVVELFYPLLTESSNNAAEVLSYFLGEEKTIRLMNEKTKSILMEQTRFVDTSGFGSENISTAKDLFYLGRYILNNRPPVLKITRGGEVQSFGKINFEIKNLWNKNIFGNDATFIGGKTGFIEESKNTGLFIFRFTDKNNNERNIAIILLGSENIKSDTQKIYIWLQNNYFVKQDLAFNEK
ncbi:L,D-transpeptidase family protein [Candidatus Parcubacteria bacterium]|nr:L,D-transpeptidase family protein [Candidatus Parcubacteria bacterium]